MTPMTFLQQVSFHLERLVAKILPKVIEAKGGEVSAHPEADGRVLAVMDTFDTGEKPVNCYREVVINDVRAVGVSPREVARVIAYDVEQKDIRFLVVLPTAPPSLIPDFVQEQVTGVRTSLLLTRREVADGRVIINYLGHSKLFEEMGTDEDEI